MVIYSPASERARLHVLQFVCRWRDHVRACQRSARPAETRRVLLGFAMPLCSKRVVCDRYRVVQRWKPDGPLTLCMTYFHLFNLQRDNNFFTGFEVGNQNQDEFANYKITLLKIYLILYQLCH